MRKAFLILGAQRSGTSATSHILSKLGVNFGNQKNFLQDTHNPIFFELNWINQLNDRLINALGYKYTDLFAPIEADLAKVSTSERIVELQQRMQQEWSDELLIGIKDPRLSLTFPFWQEALGKTHQLNVVFVFRNPKGFLESNRKLLCHWKKWDDSRHLNLWLQLNLAAIYFTRELQIYYLNYDDLMNNSFQETAALAQFFYLDQNRVNGAAAVVNRSHYHHQELSKTGFSFVDHCYRLLCSQNLTPADYLRYRTHVLLGKNQLLKEFFLRGVSLGVEDTPQ
jgi:hypothetical protein